MSLSLGTTFIVPPNLFSLFHFAYFDSSDPNHGLFGTHHCGPSGGGSVGPGLDQLCAAHDACYNRENVGWYSNLNPFTSGAAMGGCDRLLCAGLDGYQPTSTQERSGKNHGIKTGAWGVTSALGLPDAGCEFGACGGLPDGFQAQAAAPVIAAPICAIAEPCGAIVLGAAIAITGIEAGVTGY